MTDRLNDERTTTAPGKRRFVIEIFEGADGSWSGTVHPCTVRGRPRKDVELGRVDGGFNGEDAALRLVRHVPIQWAAGREYRNEDGETTFDEAEADGWTDAGLEVDSRASADAEWAPWNYEAGFDYASNRYHDEEAGR